MGIRSVVRWVGQVVAKWHQKPSSRPLPLQPHLPSTNQRRAPVLMQGDHEAFATDPMLQRFCCHTLPPCPQHHPTITTDSLDGSTTRLNAQCKTTIAYEDVKSTSAESVSSEDAPSPKQHSASGVIVDASGKRVYYGKSVADDAVTTGETSAQEQLTEGLKTTSIGTSTVEVSKPAIADEAGATEPHDATQTAVVTEQAAASDEDDIDEEHESSHTSTNTTIPEDFEEAYHTEAEGVTADEAVSKASDIEALVTSSDSVLPVGVAVDGSTEVQASSEAAAITDDVETNAAPGRVESATSATSTDDAESGLSASLDDVTTKGGEDSSIEVRDDLTEPAQSNEPPTNGSEQSSLPGDLDAATTESLGFDETSLTAVLRVSFEDVEFRAKHAFCFSNERTCSTVAVNRSGLCSALPINSNAVKLVSALSAALVVSNYVTPFSK
ncbi:unnamed protein product [Mesocestoides corti]|uniref:Uncharacterized protein n=1 Tax=Mesocestoides corti TaxID=53468 RepID=A0A0R3ULV7_MESCO|nr:unnamed protein product [Mesocestoides corti]